MLPRVSAALSKFISPIASSREAGTSFERFRPEGAKVDQDSKKHKKGALKLVKDSEKTDENQALAEVKKPVEALLNIATQSMVLTFLNILQFVQTRREFITKWLGKKTYKSFVKQQKNAAHIRKGAIFDHKTE